MWPMGTERAGTRTAAIVGRHSALPVAGPLMVTVPTVLSRSKSNLYPDTPLACELPIPE